MGVECPVCGRNLELWTTVQRSLHANACIDQEAKPPAESSGVSWDWRAAQLVGRRRNKSTRSFQSKVLKQQQPKSTRYNDNLESPMASKQETGCSIEEGEECSIPDVASTSTTLVTELAKQADNAGKEQSNTTKLKKERLPFYKVLNFDSTTFAVDAFMWGAIEGVAAYFLTHFHSDHYGGLSKSWKHGYIYCTPTTARLVKHKLRVDPQWVVELPLEKCLTVTGVEVMMLDANHCPGSAVILFNRGVLHTGDFRADWSLTHRIREIAPRLNLVYLDTTYLDPSRKFPPQKVIVDSCAEFCRQEQLRPPERSWFKASRPRRLLVLVGTYTIGKERLAVAIANALKSKIWANAAKMKILDFLDYPQLTDLLENKDGLQCQVHLVRMGDITIANLENQWRFLQRHYTDLVGFIPTGWTSSVREGETFTVDDLKGRMVSHHPFIRIFRVPYSEHSSFTELEYFCRSLQIKRIISTVPNKHNDILKDWEYRAPSESMESRCI